jgi:Brp/Blh family beta-carotene 15,15'-monooxygenase
LPPLLFFVLYFCGLHSPRHLIQAARGVSPRLALATGALFTGRAIGAGSLAWLATPGPGIEAKLLRVTFVGLAALTVPHMLLIELGRRPASAVVTG